MDLHDTPQEQAFRNEVRAWLADNLPPRCERLPPMASGIEALSRMRAWQRQVFEGGWAGLTVPVGYGGRGGDVWQQNIWNEETASAGIAPGMLAVALGMVVPTLQAHGTEAQCSRHIPRILRGESMWCQLFSEPEAGSDLASLRTTAVRDGDEWVVNGQKIWTSEAQHADHAILLARTNPRAPKHAGITYFLVDMTVPGLDIRPIVDVSGEEHFNEVFINDLVLPADAPVGAVDDGWSVANSTLSAERAVMGGGLWGIGLEQLQRLADRTGRLADPLTRQQLARTHERSVIIELLRLRARSAANARSPSTAGALLKLANATHLGAMADLAVDLLGPDGLLTGHDAPADGDWARLLVRSFSLRFAGGTSEIQRNVVAERVLGLPREPKPVP
jgi:alkylation response protein AidB-like acyl-CoA dehydrogenase